MVGANSFFNHKLKLVTSSLGKALDYVSFLLLSIELSLSKFTNYLFSKVLIYLKTNSSA